MANDEKTLGAQYEKDVESLFQLDEQEPEKEEEKEEDEDETATR